MIINDSPQIAKNLARKMSDENQAILQKWLDDQTCFSNAVDDPDTSPLATMQKIGRPMSHNQLEAKLKKLAPDLMFIWGDIHGYAKKMARTLPDGTVQDLMIYNTGILPERSIWRSEIKYLPDPDYKPGKGDNNKFYEWVPRPQSETADLFRDLGVDYAFDDKPVAWNADGHKQPYGGLYGKWALKDPGVRGPGWKRHVEPLGEKRRGWRTVLVRLVGEGVLTVSQVVKEFGNDNTPEWKQHMGYGAFTRPW